MNNNQFKETSTLSLPNLSAELCEPDERDGPTMVRIVEIHNDIEPNHEIYVDVAEARALRNWLNRVLPSESNAEHAVHDAITRALAEAGVKQEVLVGMCIEVGLEAYRDALRTNDGKP